MANSIKKENTETPLMRQYSQIKAKYPGALILFRVGDFYETFGEDAVTASKILGIVLTKRNNGGANETELAGFPHHSLDAYLPKLVRAGQRVAICDQLEDPKQAKKLVKRGVTELVTPGVTYNDKVVETKQNNYLSAVFFNQDFCGVAFFDISTGEAYLAQGSIEYVDKLLQGLKPAEVLISKNQRKKFEEFFGQKFNIYPLDEWVFGIDYAKEKLNNHFGTQTLKGFGIEHLELGIIASGACFHYLFETHHPDVQHIKKISRIDEDQYVWLDRFTIRNLELINSPHEGGVSLLDILDQTITPMGGRLLRKWLVLPLRNIPEILERQNFAESLIQSSTILNQITKLLSTVGDLERLISKVALKRVNPRELNQLSKSLDQVIAIKELLIQSEIPTLTKYGNGLLDCTELRNKLKNTLSDDAPLLINKGNVIREGIDSNLDELRKLAFSGKDFLLNLQKKESERTGISSLKIGFNNVFGYYLEVSNTHKNKVPQEWIRKQTLVNAERYITEELKVYEEKILGAESKIFEIEENLFRELIEFVSVYVSQVQINAQKISWIDCIQSFATNAIKWNYCKPIIDDSLDIEIKDARHPVIEQQLPIDQQYVPNDIKLSPDDTQIIILTGPNMSGKSAVLRQTALIVLMTQIGSFVPAAHARIGWVDKIFTRVGASDNISSGESTFMVEMLETASILNNLSSRSLILLDEIGRGTSTYDGVSLAWAIAEYIGLSKELPKTIFATHYHELNEMEKKMEKVKNFHISVKETGNQVIFLRKLVEGGSENSFGIHVAKMAGIPAQVVNRAQEILNNLEKERGNIEDSPNKKSLQKMNNPAYQINLFQPEDPRLLKIKDELNKLEINALTPVEALLKLNLFKDILKD